MKTRSIILHFFSDFRLGNAPHTRKYDMYFLPPGNTKW